MKKDRKTRIIILGAGFAGVNAGLKLQKSLYLREKSTVTVIDKKEHFLFTPLLFEVLNEEINSDHAKIKLKKLFPKFNIIKTSIFKIDFNKQTLFSKKRSYKYDYLILAIGSSTNYYQINGAKKFSHSFKNLKDIKLLKNELKKIQKNAKKRKIVIAGGGPTGVVTAIEISQTLNKKRHNIIVIDENEFPLKELPKFIQDKGTKELINNKINFRKKSRIKSIEKNKIILFNKKSQKHDLLIWTAGVKPNLIETEPIKDYKNKGYPQEATLMLKNQKNVVVIGDCSHGIDPKTNKPYPKLAQVAAKQGKHAAKNLIRLIKNKRLKDFSYNHNGYIVPLGKNKAVAEVKGIKFNGFFASIIIKIVYILKIPIWNNRVKLLKKLFFHKAGINS